VTKENRQVLQDKRNHKIQSHFVRSLKEENRQTLNELAIPRQRMSVASVLLSEKSQDVNVR